MEEDDVPSWVPRMSFDRSAYYPDLSEEYCRGYLQYERPLILAFNELMHTCAILSLRDDEATGQIVTGLEIKSACILLNIICGEDIPGVVDIYKLSLEEAQERWGYLSYLSWFRSSFLWLSGNMQSVRSMYVFLYEVEDVPSDAYSTDYYHSSSEVEDNVIQVSLSS